MRKLKLDEYISELKAQGVDRLNAASVCPVCKTVQSLASLMATGEFTSVADAMSFEGFSCIGRFTGAGPHRIGHDGVGCDWTLGGFLHLHTLEIVEDSGETHMRFEPATKEQAQALLRSLKKPIAIEQVAAGT